MFLYKLASNYYWQGGVFVENLLDFQEKLAQKYKYKKLNSILSQKVRKKYEENIPKGFKIEGDRDCRLYTKNGLLIAIGYERIVIGDYGAFIEFDSFQAVLKNIKVKEGQEYRINDSNYKEHVKYYWLTAKDKSNIKIYQQIKEVSYADYKAGMYYVSPYEVIVK